MWISSIHQPCGKSPAHPLHLRYQVINAKLLAVIQHTALMKLGLHALRPHLFSSFHFSYLPYRDSFSRMETTGRLGRLTAGRGSYLLGSQINGMPSLCGGEAFRYTYALFLSAQANSGD
jgi:hypothetical protein